MNTPETPKGAPMDFSEAERLVASARNRQSKPIANNTRVEKRDDDTYAVKLHATDVLTLHRDGRVVLRTGGWYTVTTKERIDRYAPSPIRVLSVRGEWFVDNPQPNDPRPEWPTRTVPKPFRALDPGPEPEKPTEGCIAGTIAEGDYEREVLVTKFDLERGAWREEDMVRPYEHDRGLFVGYAIKRGRAITAYGEEPWGKAPSGSVNDTSTYEQCPHCAAFERVHSAWREAMFGHSYPRGTANRGYSQMVAALEHYGSYEAWEEAWRQDGREVREARKRFSEWWNRNHMAFVDGMTFGPVGGTLRMIGITTNGELVPIRSDKLAEERRDRANLRRKIKTFVELAGKRLDEGMNTPGPGDCWYCLMHDADSGETWGDATSHEHLLSHIDEGYVVPSLLANAIAEAGYRVPGFILGVSENGERMGGQHAHTDSVTRALRKYLTKRLVAGVQAR